MSATDELAEFVLARIAEDEAAAQAAGGWSGWHRDGINSVVDGDQRLVIYGDGPAPSEAEAEHITRHDPSRVLAECEAKQRIVELHSGDADEMCQSYAGNYSYEPCPTLRALALPYANHPAYREEWRP